MLTGLSAEDMKSSLITLDEMARKLGATTSVLRERSVRKDKMVAEVLVRKVCIQFILLTFIIVTCSYFNLKMGFN